MRRLRSLRRARHLLRQLDWYRMVHVRREMNKLADRRANRGHRRCYLVKVRAKVDQAIALCADTRREESPDSSGQGGR